MRPLGIAQLDALNALATTSTGTYFPGCGFTLGTPSSSDRIFTSLERRGLVDRVKTRPSGYGVFKINAAGIKAQGSLWTNRALARSLLGDDEADLYFGFVRG
jgi:hypothetical protein